MTNSERERWADWYNGISGPFRPKKIPSGQRDDAQERIAWALEYIAVQLGDINKKMNQLRPESE